MHPEKSLSFPICPSTRTHKYQRKVYIYILCIFDLVDVSEYSGLMEGYSFFSLLHIRLFCHLKINLIFEKVIFLTFKTTQTIAITLSCPPELDGKILLPKITYILAKGYGETTLVLIWKLPPVS